MPRLTADERASLPLRYAAGESSGALAAALGVRDVTILRHLKNMGVARRDVRHLTEAVIASLPARYAAGESSASIARDIGTTDSTVLLHLKALGVRSRDPSMARRQYPLWDNAFHTLTPEAAYWLGFLMADGCVHDESKITLGLAEKDRHHVEKFRSYLRTDSRPIQSVPQTRSVAFKVHSRQLVLDLTRYGIVPRKSLIALAAGGVDDCPAFWLGVLDGDGTIDAIAKGYLRVRLMGTLGLMQQFVQFLVRHAVKGRNANNLLNVYVRPDGMATVTCLGRRAHNLLRLLYSSSPTCLDRKYKHAIDLGFQP